jgi:hypothetical protein
LSIFAQFTSPDLLSTFPTGPFNDLVLPGVRCLPACPPAVQAGLANFFISTREVPVVCGMDKQ